MQKMITILGPTASGKTPVAVRLAAEIGGEIISADSRQVYRRMDIGTGKDLGDYVVRSQKSGVIGKWLVISNDRTLSPDRYPGAGNEV